VPATDDRWDVVVVGLRDPAHAAAMLTVAELAHYASLPPHDIERMLAEGEVLMLESLDRAEAERAAYDLAELGAMVDLRLAMTDSGVFPVFKPDSERQIGVAVGGLIDDSATPPTVGAAVGLPQLEPDLEAPGTPRPRTASSRAPSGAPRRGAQVTAGPPGLDEEPPPPPLPHEEPGRGGLGAGLPARSAEGGAGARPRAQTPAPGRAKARPTDLESLLADLAPAAVAPKLPPRLQRASAATEGGSSKLELDFAAAGLTPPSSRGLGATPAPGGPRVEPSAGGSLPRASAGRMGATGSGFLDTWRSDGIAAVLVGLGVGLALSLALAVQMQRSGVRDRLPPLEDELAVALADPAGVAAGKRRAPAVIESELDDALDELQRSFLLWWLAPGALAGLLLSRL
jgi:hypothetical protein